MSDTSLGLLIITIFYIFSVIIFILFKYNQIDKDKNKNE